MPDIRPFSLADAYKSVGSPIDSATKMMGLVRGGQQIKEYQRGLEQDEQRRSILQGLGQGQTVPDTVDRLMRGGDVDTAGKLQQLGASRASAAAAQAKAQRERALETSQMISQMYDSWLVGEDGKQLGESAKRANINSGLKRLHAMGLIDDKELKSRTNRPDLVETDMRRLKGAMAQAADEAAAKRGPDTLTDVNDRRRYMGGERHGELVFPEVTAEDDDPSALAEKTAAILRANPHLDEASASNIATGVVSIQTDPVLKQPFFVDKATQKAVPVVLPQQAQQAAPKRPDAKVSLYDLAKSGEVAGIVPWALEFLGETAGQIPGVPVATETIEARQAVRTGQNELLRSLSINPRFPVAEMKRIREEVSIEPRIFDSKAALLSRMRSVDRSLRTRLENELATSVDESQPVMQRRNAAAAARDIANYLKLLNVPQEEEVDQGVATPQTQEDFDALPSGALFVDPDSGETRKKR